ncbi:hypothetical protein Tco_0377521 [Tanacetum coccineum]
MAYYCLGDGTTRTKKYEELSVAEKLQADYDLKATNIVLEGLPSDVYAIVNHHKVGKEIWDRVKLLVQGTKFGVVDVVVVSGEAAAEGWQRRLDGSGGGGAWGSGLSRSGDGESFGTWPEKYRRKIFPATAAYWWPESSGGGGAAGGGECWPAAGVGCRDF